MGTKGTIFSTTKEEYVVGARHGRLWSQAEIDDLECWFYQGKNLSEIVTLSQRSTGGVISKLCSLRLINAVSNSTNSGAAQLDPKACDHGWLYVRGAEGQWVTHRKLTSGEIEEAYDQAADMAVRQGTQVRAG